MKIRSLLVTGLVLSISALPVLAQGAESPRLIGGVEHSDRLAPIDEQAALGAVFQDASGNPNNAALPSGNSIPAVAGHPSRAAAMKSTKAQTAPGLSASARSKSTTNLPGGSLVSNAAAGQKGAQAVSSYRNPQLYLRSGRPVADPAMDAYRKRLHEVIVANIAAKPQLAGRQNAKVTVAKSGGQKIQVKVPFWLSGSWQRQETNELSRVELPSGRKLAPVGQQAAKVTDVFGTFKDKKGQVWMTVPLGNTGVVDRGVALDCHQVRRYELVITGPDTALVKVQACHFVVDKRSRRLLQAYQDEEFNEYKLVSTGLVRTLSSVKVFDQQGLPKMQTRAVSMEKRIKTI